MKKVLSVLCVVMLVLGMTMTAFTASAEENLYDKAAEGELLLTVKFDGSMTNWAPAKSVNSVADLTVTADPIDPTKCTVVADPEKGGKDSAKNRWGGEFAGLPLGETNAYTIYFTVIRDKATSSSDPNFGVFVDDYYGIYGYSTKTKLMNIGSSLTGHNYVTYKDAGIDAEGNAFSTDGYSSQSFAMEVNGQNSTMKYYIKDTTGKWVLVDKSEPDQIICYMTENLGLYFYQYYANAPVTVQDVTIYKGMVISGDKLEEVTTAEETTAAATTAEVTTAEVTTAEVTTAAEVNDTTAAAAVTTTAPAAKSGCGSSVAIGSAIAMVCAAAFVLSKKKN